DKPSPVICTNITSTAGQDRAVYLNCSTQDEEKDRELTVILHTALKSVHTETREQTLHLSVTHQLTNSSGWISNITSSSRTLKQLFWWTCRDCLHRNISQEEIQSNMKGNTDQNTV
ncbi:uncharacterized, partial [Tachysurus ichikawai]